MYQQIRQSSGRHAGYFSGLPKGSWLGPLEALDDLVGQASDSSEGEISWNSQGIMLMQSTNRNGLRFQIS